MKKTKELFDNLNDLSILNNYEYPILILQDIPNIINILKNSLDLSEYRIIDNNIYLHKTCKIDENVKIQGPCIIMEGATINHNVYIRENVIIGKNSHIANSTEIKNSILIGNNKLPHFNYVGDSILGNNVHLGAGAIISNLRFDKQNIKVEKEDTNLCKIGAFIGDNTEIGCNAVISPGSVITKNSIIYPLTFYKDDQKVNYL